MTGPERGLWIDDAHQRDDLATFVDRALRLDDAAVVRLRARGGDGEQVVAWVATGFDALASRVFAARLRPGDLSAGADALRAGLSVSHGGYIDTGMPMDSAWRGGLPPETGFVHVDDVPAKVMLDLAEQGTTLAKEHGGAHGPPTSLLDQDVVVVSSEELSVGVPMRCVFALTAMGFLPPSGESLSAGEIVRVRAHAAWLRIDARFGSVYRRRGAPSLVLG
ncbi:hypothetical protein [Mycolicibacterium brisbanense]|uniref:Uncharacterized protein n=1 Tax=Mycolicibacterium brisbanense TaxID=146020 RepID=A0A100W0X4_9MYCO|nr:hypothetical protein [Mycolicibacterium brisbanense]MCV7156886.1 hypothetical protein [Mycolicibacterium brisbanense]GAS89604.1 hypothetical protein RMCB_3700 [Mycolicibacterium brisbanense]